MHGRWSRSRCRGHRRPHPRRPSCMHRPRRTSCISSIASVIGSSRAATATATPRCGRSAFTSTSRTTKASPHGRGCNPILATRTMSSWRRAPIPCCCERRASGSTRSIGSSHAFPNFSIRPMFRPHAKSSSACDRHSTTGGTIARRARSPHRSPRCRRRFAPATSRTSLPSCTASSALRRPTTRRCPSSSSDASHRRSRRRPNRSVATRSSRSETRRPRCICRSWSTSTCTICSGACRRNASRRCTRVCSAPTVRTDRWSGSPHGTCSTRRWRRRSATVASHDRSRPRTSRGAAPAPRPL